MLGKLLTSILVTLVLSPMLTCLVETPIVKKLLHFDNILFICAVNVLTNVALNVICYAIIWWMPSVYYLFLAVSEALLIPISEAALFMLATDKKRRCIWVSYLANAASFSFGMILNAVIDRIGVFYA